MVIYIWLLVRCPDLKLYCIYMYTNWVFGTSDCVLFIKVSSFRGILIRGALL